MPQRRRLLLLIVVVAAVILGAGACGDDKDSTAESGQGGSGSAVTIKDFKFEPDSLDAKAGATIKVTNDDGTTHTATADDKSFDTGRLDGGKAGEITLSKAGEVKYHCDIHDYMKGSIQVSG